MYKIYCEYLLRLLKQLGNSSNAKYYLKIRPHEYTLCVYYHNEQYIQFTVPEYQFGVTTTHTFELSKEHIDYIKSIPIKQAKDNFTIDINDHLGQFSFNDYTSTLKLSYPIYEDETRTLVESIPLHSFLISDLSSLLSNCPLNQNALMYISVDKGIVLINEDVTIATLKTNVYGNSEVDGVIHTPRFIGKVLDSAIPEEVLHINVYENNVRSINFCTGLYVGKKRLVGYKVEINLSSNDSSQNYKNLLDLYSEVKEQGTTYTLDIKYLKRVLDSQSNSKLVDTRGLVKITDKDKLPLDVVSRLFKDSESDVKIIKYQDKILIENEVCILTTLNLKLSESSVNDNESRLASTDSDSGQ